MNHLEPPRNLVPFPLLEGRPGTTWCCAGWPTPDTLWAELIAEKAHQQLSPASWQRWSSLSCEALGAPLGPSKAMSQRVARVCAVHVGAPFASLSPQLALNHFACCQGWMGAGWDDTSADTLLVEFEAPECHAWGWLSNSGAEAQIVLLTAQQYVAMAKSMLSNVDGLYRAQRVTPVFTGHWSSALVPVMECLKEVCRGAEPEYQEDVEDQREGELCLI